MTLDTGGMKTGSHEAIRDVNRLEGSFGKIGSTLSGIKTAITGVFALDAVRMGLDVVRSGIDLFNQLRNEIDETSKAARRLGMSTQDMRELNLVADLSGVDGFQSSIERMTKGISEAAGGGGRAKDAIAELGLDAGSLEQMGSQKALLAIADAMGSIPNEADRVRIAMKIFGNDGVEMLSLMEGGATNLQAQLETSAALLGNLSDEQAAKVEKFNDNITRMTAAMRAQLQMMAAGIADAMNNHPDLVNALGDAIGLGTQARSITGIFGLGDDLEKVAEGAAKIARMEDRRKVSAAERLAIAKQTADQEERAAKAVAKGNDLQDSITSKLEEMSLGPRGARIQQWKRESLAAGADPDKIERQAKQMELWGKVIDAIEAKQKRFDDAQSMLEDAKSPYEKHLDQVDKLNRYRREGLLTEEQYNKLLEQENKRFKEIQDRGNPLVAKAGQIKEAIRTPLDDLQKGMAEIDEMISQGLLSDEEAGKARNKLLDDYAGTLGTPATESPQALLAGTAEAYNAEIRAPAMDTKEYLRKIAEEHLAELRQQNTHLQTIASKPEPKVASVGR
jgi:hypothetical protein